MTNLDQQRRRVLSGIQPTADSFHLGNYLGALRQWVQMQETHDALYCIVDMHAITVQQDPELLRHRTRLSAAQLLALGLDGDKCTLFVQSHVLEHNRLGWILECLAGFGEASRMVQFKDKSVKQGGDRVSVGLFTYPILQAADILLYRAHEVPVGEDQRQHIELTRDLAIRFNSRFGATLTVPEAYIPPGSAKVNDLQVPTQKMSKSASSPAGIIELLDDPAVSLKKIRSAVTDADSEIRFDPQLKPGVSNLIAIYAALSGSSITSVEKLYAGQGYGSLKKDLAELVHNFVSPLRQRVDEYMRDTTELDRILVAGAKRARQIAAETTSDVEKRIGFLGRLD